MKTSIQVHAAISEVGPVTRELLDDIVRSDDTLAGEDPRLAQYMAALDVLRWMTTDAEQRPLLEYLRDESRTEQFVQYIESFAR